MATVYESRESILKTIDEIIEDNNYKGVRAKSPKAKRDHIRIINFWESVKHHLTLSENGKQVHNG